MTVSQVPPEAEGLLERIADTALDDDYYAVSPDEAGHQPRFNSVLTFAVLAVFALMVTITAVQTRNDRPATDLERQTLISDIQTRKILQANRVEAADALRAEVTELRASTGRQDPSLGKTRVLTGDRAARGPGITITLGAGPSDVSGSRVTDTDLQLMVNGLWYAGAEALAVNGQRVGSLTAIRTAGRQITINFRSVGPPYVVTALGDRDSLAQRFADNAGGQYWDERRRTSGLTFVVRRSGELNVPVVPRDRLMLRHAAPIEEESP